MVLIRIQEQEILKTKTVWLYLEEMRHRIRHDLDQRAKQRIYVKLIGGIIYVLSEYSRIYFANSILYFGDYIFYSPIKKVTLVVDYQVSEKYFGSYKQWCICWVFLHSECYGI